MRRRHNRPVINDWVVNAISLGLWLACVASFLLLVAVIATHEAQAVVFIDWLRDKLKR